MKLMAENYKWQDYVTNIQNILNEEVNLDWLIQIEKVIAQILKRI